MANSSKSILQWPVRVNHDFCEWPIPVKTALCSVREQVTKEEKQWIGNRIITNLTLGKQPAGNSLLQDKKKRITCNAHYHDCSCHTAPHGQE